MAHFQQSVEYFGGRLRQFIDLQLAKKSQILEHKNRKMTLSYQTVTNGGRRILTLCGIFFI